MAWHPFLLTYCNSHPGLLVTLASTPSSLFRHASMTTNTRFSPEPWWTGTFWRMKFDSNSHSLHSSHHYLPPTESSHGSPAVTGVYAHGWSSSEDPMWGNLYTSAFSRTTSASIQCKHVDGWKSNGWNTVSQNSGVWEWWQQRNYLCDYSDCMVPVMKGRRPS